MVAAVALLGHGAKALGAKRVCRYASLRVMCCDVPVVAHSIQELAIPRELHVVDGSSPAAPVNHLGGAQLVFVVPQVHIAAVAAHGEHGTTAWAPYHALDAPIEEALLVREAQRAQHVDEQPVLQALAVPHHRANDRAAAIVPPSTPVQSRRQHRANHTFLTLPVEGLRPRRPRVLYTFLESASLQVRCNRFQKLPQNVSPPTDHSQLLFGK